MINNLLWNIKRVFCSLFLAERTYKMNKTKIENLITYTSKEIKEAPMFKELVENLIKKNKRKDN